MFKGNIIAEKVKNLPAHMAVYGKRRGGGGNVTCGYGIGKGAMIHYHRILAAVPGVLTGGFAAGKVAGIWNKGWFLGI